MRRFAEKYLEKEKTVLLCGALKDKMTENLAGQLSRTAREAVTVTPDNREFTEVYETRVTPKTSSGDAIREVVKRGRTTLLYGCKVIYPDLSKYPERDDPDNPIYW